MGAVMRVPHELIATSAARLANDLEPCAPSANSVGCWPLARSCASPKPPPGCWAPRALICSSAPYIRVGTRRAVEEAAEKTPDGKFYVSASDDSVLIPVSKSYDPAIPHLPKTADGKYYLDAATDIRYPVDPGYHLGHVRGEEWAANGKRRSVNTGHANSSSTTATIRRSTASKTPPAISAASSNYPGRQDDRTRS